MSNLKAILSARRREIQISICVAAFLVGFLSAFVAPARAASEVIQVAVHGGRLIKLPSPAMNVFVADPEIADVQVPSTSSLYVLGKKAGRTTLYALNETGDPIVAATVHVTHDIGALRGLLAQELPAAELSVRSVPGGIVLGGEVASSADADHAVSLAGGFIGQGDKVINQLGVRAPTQVNLRVRVAEMSRDVAKQLGFNWDAAFNDGSFSLGLLSGQPGSAASPELLSAGFTRGNFDLLAVVDALAQEGVVTTLAEPNLTAISGETASFLAGGEFPIAVGQDDDGVTIEFKQFGVSLDFTPTVLSANRISLRVRPEVSELSDAFAIESSDIVIPGIEVRRAETTVELASGQSFAIAGLMDNRSDTTISRVPGLGNLPILGPLFQSSEFQRNETELIIIVTPYIVKPIDIAAKDIPTPIDRFKPASDLERLLLQRIGQRPEPEGTVGVLSDGGSRLKGEAGFYY